jgi:hypothetical protein
MKSICLEAFPGELSTGEGHGGGLNIIFEGTSIEISEYYCGPVFMNRRKGLDCRSIYRR